MNAVGEHDRMIGNLVMYGVVAEVDASGLRCRVDCDGLRTDWIPWLAARAYEGMRAWAAPEVGEQVVVLSPYGDPSQGIVIGSVFQDAFPPRGNVPEIREFAFGDGTILRYNTNNHLLKIDLSQSSGNVQIICNTATVTASGSVTLETPTTHATGDLKVDGKIEAGGDITTPAEVMAGNIGLKTHKHPTAGTGSPSAPIP